MWVATPLIALFAGFYVTSAYTKPGSVVYPLGMAILGITLALAGVCFTVPESTDGSKSLYYAGEKFLHSALLLIQSVMLVYIKEEISGSGWWKQHAGLRVAVLGAIAGLLALTSGGAAVCWYWAFDAANRQSWFNWRSKIESLNADQTEPSLATPLKAANSSSETQEPPVTQVAPKVSKV